MKPARSYLSAICLCVLLAFGVAASPAIARDIALTPEQRDQLKALGTEIKTRTMREREQLMRARRELFEAYRDYDMDERKVRAAAAMVNDSQLDLLKGHLENQIALRRVLNKEQWEAFSARMRGGMGGMMTGVSHHEEGPLDRLPDRQAIESLGLNSDQVRQIWKLSASSERRRAMEDLRRDARRMVEIYSRYDLDTAAARKLIDSIHKTQVTMSDLTHKRQQALRHILTKQQFERMMDDAAKRMQSRPRPGRKA